LTLRLYPPVPKHLDDLGVLCGESAGMAIWYE
jgi:hypothetical protein